MEMGYSGVKLRTQQAARRAYRLRPSTPHREFGCDAVSHSVFMQQ